MRDIDAIRAIHEQLIWSQRFHEGSNVRDPADRYVLYRSQLLVIICTQVQS
jgi:hypothetical protein